MKEEELSGPLTSIAYIVVAPPAFGARKRLAQTRQHAFCGQERWHDGDDYDY